MFPTSMTVAMLDVMAFLLLVITFVLVFIIHRGLQTRWILCTALLVKHMRAIMLLVFMFAGISLKI